MNAPFFKTSGVGYPASVSKFAGRISDVDSHEWMPPEMWVQEFGPEVAIFAEIEKKTLEGYKQKGKLFRNSLTEFGGELNWDAAWRTKGPGAPSSYDMKERVEVLDYTGISRQLVFPGTVALQGAWFLGGCEDPSFFPQITGDRRAYAMKLIESHSQWAVRQSRVSERVRPVATLIGESPDELHAKAKSYIDQGVRAFWLPSSMPPGGKSPAHSEIDRFWSLCAESNTVVTLHVGNELEFFKTLEWQKAEAFEGWGLGGEISFDPWFVSNIPTPTQNFATTMITGGVFERHPMLRLGIIETSAHWIGPLAKYLDLWSLNTSSMMWREKLPLMPSDYIRRNIRVSGFAFEPIDQYIDCYGLQEVYCFATDFPHVEGGTDPMGFWADRLSRHGHDVMEKFFVRNGQWLLPD